MKITRIHTRVCTSLLLASFAIGQEGLVRPGCQTGTRDRRLQRAAQRQLRTRRSTRTASPTRWRSGDWNTGSKVAWDTAVAHTRQGQRPHRLRDRRAARVVLVPSCWSGQGRGSSRPGSAPTPCRPRPRKARSRASSRSTTRERSAACSTPTANPRTGNGKRSPCRSSCRRAPSTSISSCSTSSPRGVVWWDDASLRFDVAEVQTPRGAPSSSKRSVPSRPLP